MDKKWWTLVAVSFGTFMLLLDVTIVNVALPAIQSSLGATFSDLQWVVDAYALTLAALLLTAGSLADLYGRRLVFVIGVALFTAGSLLCGFATDPLFLILSRGAQGIGGAAMFATSLALLAQAFRGKERGVAFGVWGAVTGVAVAVGPVLGGVITSGLSWRWIFFVNAPVGAVAIVIAAMKVQESRERSARRPDWAGFVLFTGALATLVYGLIRASERSWTDLGVLICFGVAFGLFVAFLIAERTGNHPMFDLSLFRVPTFVGGLVAAFGLSASLFALLLYIVLYFQDLLGYSPLQTGVRLVIISGGILVTSAAAGRLTARVPIRLLIGPGLVLVGLGLVLMSGLDARSSWTALIPGFIVGGLGTGLVNPPLASTAVGVVEPQRAGMASGINSTFRQVGIATGIAALGSIFATKEHSDLQSNLASVPSLAHRVPEIATALRNGSAATLLRQVPPAVRPRLELALRSSFTDGLNEILLIGAAIAFAAAVASFFLIRNKDFAAGSQGDPGTVAAAA
ncbi:MAG: drug resistance transporter, EmrB/QacA subfamily [Acidimicrobiaceae bacterium]|nr:drug resistance transporter, EmrB/QacA subfamily [Acidimicrobiaceae bacterium]